MSLCQVSDVAVPSAGQEPRPSPGQTRDGGDGEQPEGSLYEAVPQLMRHGRQLTSQ